ncbi:MAG: DUF4397 domain-containing protein, partial [Chitinophagales bacterium]|nr:DUF4397 domain-containing protein [Chitinophagales bacterium]
MKKILFTLSMCLLFNLIKVQAQLSQDSVFIQVIHNSPDPAADTVDVWFFVPLVNTEFQVLKNFAFRNATPVVKSIPGAPVGYIPANLPFEVRIKPKGSTNTTPPVFSKNFPAGLPKGAYHIFATGVLSQNLKDSIPGNDEAFDIIGYPNALFSAPADTANIRIVHGAPDAPGVRVSAGVTTFTFAPVVDSLVFNESADAKIKVKPLRVWISPQGVPHTGAIAKYNGNGVKNTGGLGYVVFASGFLKPSIAPNLPSFGLFVALPNGTVVPLPEEVPAGRVQIIHNSGDPALASNVAAFVSGDKLPLTLSFRGGFESTAFISDFDYSIGVAPNGGNTPTVTFPTISFNPNEQRILVVGGVSNPSQFKPNPNGFDISLKMYSFSPAEFTAPAGQTKFLVFHGVTDAPFVDVFAPLISQTIVDNLGYGQFINQYLGPFPAAALSGQTLQVKDSAQSVIVSSHTVSAAQATAIDGKAILVFASGFLDTANNQNGKSFSLFAAISTGSPTPTVVELQKVVPSDVYD